MTEIEAKVKLERPHDVEERLRRMARFERTRVTEDVYFAPAHLAPADVDPARHVVFRIRTLDGQHQLTTKRRRQVAGVEVNEEIDCPLPDVAAFTRFAAAIGFTPFVTKRKESRIYVQGDLALELNHVIGLGWFLEIELLCAADQALAEAAAERVAAAFASLGFGREQFERRLYIDLLRAR
ncbi:MAG: class IV adenylate cyclase [Planctomycetota bacterium]